MSILFFEKNALSTRPNELAYFNNIKETNYEKNLIINKMDLKINDEPYNIFPPYIVVEEVRFEIVCERLIDKHSSSGGAGGGGGAKPYKLDELKEIAKQNKINVNNINKNQIVKLLRNTFCKFND